MAGKSSAKKTGRKSTKLPDSFYEKAIVDDLLEEREHCQKDHDNATDIIKLDNWISGEYVDGAIRSAVMEDPALSHSVKVFPVYATERQRDNLARVVGDEIAKNFPDFEEDLSEEEDQITNTAFAQLENDGITDVNLFALFLSACRAKKALWPKSERANIQTKDQWVIPLLLNENHYTTLVVHFQANNKVNIKYFDSAEESKKFPPEVNNIIKGLRKHLTSIGNYKIETVQNLSEAIQNDNYNCGVFAFYRSLQLVYENAGKSSSRNKYSKKVTGDDDFMIAQRQAMVKLLKKRNYNVEFVHEYEYEYEDKWLDLPMKKIGIPLLVATLLFIFVPVARLLLLFAGLAAAVFTFRKGIKNFFEVNNELEKDIASSDEPFDEPSKEQGVKLTISKNLLPGLQAEKEKKKEKGSKSSDQATPKKGSRKAIV